MATEKQLGWLCSYTPLEIFYAAGLSPQRIIGHAQPIQSADTYMSPNICQYVRSTVDVLMGGGYDHLEGVVFVNSCDAMRRLYDIWRNYRPSKFHFILDLPAGRTNDDINYYQNQLESLLHAIESHLKIKIDEETLDMAIQGLQGVRGRYQRLQKLRKKKPAGITASKIYTLTHLLFMTDIGTWTSRVDAILARLPTENREDRPRVLLAGSPIHNPEFISVLENLGLDVVYDDLCTGSRFFDVEIPPGSDPLFRLSQAYLNKPSCARMVMLEDRVQNILTKCKEYAADGVIHHNLKFCDTYSYDVPELKRALTNEGIPSLFLEGDSTLGGIGQLKTRIEAFREILKGGL